MTQIEALAGRCIQLVVDALDHLRGLLLDPNERTFWVGLIAAALVTLALAGVRGSSGLRLRHFWNPSARVDYGFVLTRPLVAALFGLPSFLTTYAVAMATLRALQGWGGPVAPFAGAVHPTVVATVYTAVLFVAWDLSRFALHWLMHRSALLWQFHQVHHSATSLTPLTLHRVHPVESVLYQLRGVLVTGALTGVFAYAFGPRTVELQLWGVNALGLCFSVVSGNLRHSHVWWSFGPRLERWLISPAQHQLHHGAGIEDSGCNLGTWLALWDRAAGTLRTATVPPARFGLPAKSCNHRAESMLSALFDPLLAVFGRLAGWSRLFVLVSLVFLPATVLASEPPPDDLDVDLTDFDPEEEPASEPEPEPEPGAKAPETVATEAAEVEGEVEVEVEGEDFDAATPTVSIIGIPEELPRVVGSAHVVDEATLERQEHDDIHRVLQAVPGVYVRGEDGFGLRPNIGLRGADPNRSAKVTLMEDGVLFGPAPYSAPAAYYFPMMTRMVGVEVFKGPASIRFGPNTVGGAINLQTRDIPQNLETGIDVAAGLWGYGKLHGYAGRSWKRFGVLFEGARVQSNGFKELDGGGDTGFRKNEFMLKTRLHGDPGARVYQQFDVKMGLSTEVSDETYLGLTDDDFAANPYRRYRASALDRMDWYRTQAQASYFVASGIVEFQSTLYRHDFSRAWKKFNAFAGTVAPEPYALFQSPDTGTNAIYLSLLRGELDSTSTDENLLIGTNQRDFVSQGWQNVLRISPTTRYVDQTIELGARLHADHVARRHDDDEYAMIAGHPVLVAGTRRVTTVNRGEAIAGSFHLVDEIRFVDRFTVSPGARVEVIRTSFVDRTPDATGAPPSDVEPLTSVDTVFLPGIGLHAQATKWLGLLAGVHSGFSPKAPGDEASVEAERSVNYEAGLRATHAGFRGEAIGFVNDYSNLVSNCTFSQGCDDTLVGAQFSGGEVLVAGAETLVRQGFDFDGAGWLDGTATYTFTHTRFANTFSSPSPFLGEVTRGDAVPYVPTHVASLQLAGGMRRWGIHGQLFYNGQMRDTPGRGSIPAQERIDRFLTLDLGGNVFITPRAQFYLNVGNATAAQYAVARRPFGIRPGSRFTAIVGFKHNFG